MLLPDLSTMLRQAGGRDKDVADVIIVAQHQAATRWPASQVLDTTGMAVDESLGAAVKRGLLLG